jgi:phospholipid/cholesterol/gamma-HCH transport system substrate-binding protein
MTSHRARNRSLLFGVIALLALALVVALVVLRPGRQATKVVALFPSVIGLYPSDSVRVLGVPVGKIETIEPRAHDVKVTMSIDEGIKIPADAQALIISPNLVSARFIQLTPVYDEKVGGPVIANDATIGLDRTGIPVEWNDVKEQLTQLSSQFGPTGAGLAGPLSNLVDTAAAAFDGNGDSFRNALHELSQTAGRLGDSRGDLFGTIKNLQVLVNALSHSNEQIVQFSNHVASVSQVLADSSTGLDSTLGTLNVALRDVKELLQDNNDALIGSVNKLTGLTSILTEQSDNLEQVLHVTPNGLANFYNIYEPAQGTVAGVLSVPNFANPVQFICAGNFETGANPDNYKRAEICRERMAPVLRRLTMNFPPILFHPITSITAYKGQIIYDTPATEAKARTPVPNLQWESAPGVAPPAIPPGAALGDFVLPPPAVQGQVSPGPAYVVGSGPPPGPAPEPAGVAPAAASTPGGGG